MNTKQAMLFAVKFANALQLVQAEKILLEIIAQDVNFHPAFYMLGQIAFQSGRFDLAAQYFQTAITFNKNIAQYHRDLAEAMSCIGNPQAALSSINLSIQINSNDPNAHFVAGNILMNYGEVEQAIMAFEKTISLDSNHEFAHNNLGSLYETSNRMKEAKHEYEKAIKINNGNVLAQNNLATLLIAEGEIEVAKDILNKVIEIQPDYIEAHNNLSALKRYQEGDAHINILKSLLNDVEKMPLENRIRLHFNLGKVYSDLEDYDKAFYHYHSSNKLKRLTYEYDENYVRKTAENIKTIFSKAYVKKTIFERTEVPEKERLYPIFVVGMTRSGSSLIEQILSSHSNVHSGGELSILGELVFEQIGKFPDDVKNVTEYKLKEIRLEYLKRLRELNPDAQFIVDKMPGNYQYAGLIKKILPEAFIVNTNRNAIDCCVSNYTQLFRRTIAYTNDLGELGRYYKIYNGLMDHWRTVLPSTILYDISYENVVADLEGEARKLIDFVGLEWEERCLSFHKNKGTVRTASAAQVRKPIYKTSMEKWRVYEKHLGPLFDALGLSKLDIN